MEAPTPALTLLKSVLLEYLALMEKVIELPSLALTKSLGLPSAVTSMRQTEGGIDTVLDALQELHCIADADTAKGVAQALALPGKRLSPTAKTLLRDAVLRMWDGPDPVIVFPEDNPLEGSMVALDLLHGFEALGASNFRVAPQPGQHVLVLDATSVPWMCFLAGLKGNDLAVVIPDGMNVDTAAPKFQAVARRMAVLAGYTPLQPLRFCPESGFFKMLETVWPSEAPHAAV
jgi:hypothetical protein